MVLTLVCRKLFLQVITSIVLPLVGFLKAITLIALAGYWLRYELVTILRYQICHMLSHIKARCLDIVFFQINLTLVRLFI